MPPPDPKEEQPSFAGLRPGRRKGRVPAAEKLAVVLLLPIGLGLALLYASSKPAWWATWMTAVLTLGALILALWVISRSLRR